VLLLRRGEIESFGSHEDLLRDSRLYRRIFSHYDEADLAPRSSHGKEA
jgi:ATP-binding cassette, subfamily B, bacterial